MANLPKVNDLRKLDQVLGDITAKLDRISGINNLFEVRTEPYDDVAHSLDAIGAVSERWSKTLRKIYDKNKDLAKQHDGQLKVLEKIQKKMERLEELEKEKGKLTKRQQDQLEDLTEEYGDHLKKLEDIHGQIDKMPGKWTTIAKLIGGSVWGAVNKVGKAITELGIGMTVGFLEGLEKAAMKVYELFERWTKAMGALNMRIGGMSKGMGVMTVEAKKTEAEIRALTDNFGEGLELFQEWQEGFQRVPGDTKAAREEYEKFRKTGIEAARGLGLGGEEAGDFARVMGQLGETSKDVTGNFADMIRNSRAAGVSTNKFAREVVGAKNFMVSFGKSGQKTVGIALAFARSMGVSAKSLEGFTKTTDTFESAAQAAAKLNTVFGTSIDSLQLMMEEDPSKRFEMVRQQLLRQGRDIEHLSRRERNFIGQTLGLAEDEVAGFLKSGQSLEEFQKKQADEKEKAKNDEKLLREAQLKTAQTMYAFGQQIDRITFKIAKVLRPFTDMIGLTKKGKEGFVGLGELANRVFDGIDQFLTKLSKNDSFNRLLTDLGGIIKKRFDQIMEWAQSEDMQSWVHSISEGIHGWVDRIDTAIDVITKFFKTAEPILKYVVEKSSLISEIWIGIKAAFAAISGANTLFKIAKGVGNVAKMLGGGGGAEAAAAEGAAATGGGGVGAGLGVAGGLSMGAVGLAVASPGLMAMGMYKSQQRQDAMNKNLNDAALERVKNELRGRMTAGESYSDIENDLVMSHDRGERPPYGVSWKTISQALDEIGPSSPSVASPVAPTAPAEPEPAKKAQPNLVKKKAASPAGEQTAGNVYLDGTQVGKVLGPILGNMSVREAGTMPGVQ